MRNLSIAILLCICTLWACKHKDDPTPSNTCVAGMGGDVTLRLIFEHHRALIKGKRAYLDSVYFKYNTQEYPSNGAWDAIVVGVKDSFAVTVKNMKCGQYYIFGGAQDTTLGAPYLYNNKRVQGGSPLYVSQTSGQVTDTIHISE